MLAPWKKSYDKPKQHIKKQRQIALPTKVCIIKTMVFPAVLYEWESWTIKKAEWRRIDAFKVWSWGRPLKVPWTAQRSKQSILKEEINPEYSLDRLMLKLKLQYFGHLMWRLTHWKRLWCQERLRTGGEGGDRGWDGWMASVTQWTCLFSLSKLWEMVKDREAWHAAVRGVTKSRIQPSEWTTTMEFSSSTLQLCFCECGINSTHLNSTKELITAPLSLPFQPKCD